MADVSRKHHTVPQFYLKGFATGSRQIGTVQLPGTKRFVQSTSKASAHTDFYAVPGHEEGPDAFEKGLSRMEGEAARLIRRITEEHVWPLSPEDRELLAAFLTVHRPHQSDAAADTQACPLLPVSPMDSLSILSSFAPDV